MRLSIRSFFHVGFTVASSIVRRALIVTSLISLNENTVILPSYCKLIMLKPFKRTIDGLWKPEKLLESIFLAANPRNHQLAAAIFVSFLSAIFHKTWVSMGTIEYHCDPVGYFSALITPRCNFMTFPSPFRATLRSLGVR